MLSVQRVSCVHTQILEIGRPGNGAVTATAFFRGQLFAGYSNGIIRVMIFPYARIVLNTKTYNLLCGQY
jgi:hypothetical protein